ncbi:hypothetical protein N9T29_00335 [Candidatus Pelagibacter sp.]|nr:hypothetical protein [Candidatus Pelagibacter sp.]
MHILKALYIFFVVLALNIFFFSTTNLNAKAYLIEDIEISEPLENNFDKDSLINRGFEKAFYELINTLIRSSDFKKIKTIRINEIKGMVESFSIKEEKFINQIYHVNLGVSFNKKKVFNYLEAKNIFPTQIVKENFLFIPIIIDQEGEEMLIFSSNPLYEKWNNQDIKTSLIKYLLPTEDLEDINLIKSKYIDIENYDFDQIIEKYFLNHSIVALIFKNENETKILSKINIKNEKIIKNNSFKNFDFNNDSEVESLINKLKIIYEDLWKDHNQINTSIKLPLLIKVNNKNLNISLKFEEVLSNVDLIRNYSIYKFDKNFIYYEVIFNGTPKKFINIMNNKNYKFDIQKKIWILR